MAKKVRRVKKKRQQKKQSSSLEADKFTKVLDDEITNGLQQLSATEQFRLEYAYVVKDLRRVLILAAFMFALLIAVNLLLR